MLPFSYLIIHMETEAALNKLKAAGGEARQNAELVEAVMANVRYPHDRHQHAAMDAECKSKNVKQNFFVLRPADHTARRAAAVRQPEAKSLRITVPRR